MKNIYPIVVPLAYFDLPEGIPVSPLGIDAFGIVRTLGNNLYTLLVTVTDDFIKNVCAEDLAKAGLDRTAAERGALENISSIASSGRSIERTINKTSSGFHWSIWLGDRFTSSCILWPGLYEWGRRELETDQLIVCAPQKQFLCIAALGDVDFRRDIKGYLENVVADMDGQISTVWFFLTPSGIFETDWEPRITAERQWLSRYTPIEIEEAPQQLQAQLQATGGDSMFWRKKQQERWTSPVGNSGEIDIIGPRQDGGVDLFLVVGRPLDVSDKTIQVFGAKFRDYCQYVESDVFLQEFGPPSPERVRICVRSDWEIPTELMDIIADIRHEESLPAEIAIYYEDPA